MSDTLEKSMLQAFTLVCLLFLVLTMLVVVGWTGGHDGTRESLTVYYDECIESKKEPYLSTEPTYTTEARYWGTLTVQNGTVDVIRYKDVCTKWMLVRKVGN